MAPKLHWLAPDAPPDSFPETHLALTDPDGLLAIGGDLSIERLLVAYGRGIFPWYQDDQPILWWSPDPRAVLFPAELRISRSLRKTLRKNQYEVSIDQDFAGVIDGCARSRELQGDDGGTWITDDMRQAYLRLHRAGHAHSIETWLGEQLVGGLYGVNIGAAFFGESMFSRSSDASKVALVKLAAICRERGIRLIDCQIASAHLASLGSQQISRDEFSKLLSRYTALPTRGDWAEMARDSRSLVPEGA